MNFFFVRVSSSCVFILPETDRFVHTVGERRTTSDDATHQRSDCRPFTYEQNPHDTRRVCDAHKIQVNKHKPQINCSQTLRVFFRQRVLVQDIKSWKLSRVCLTQLAASKQDLHKQSCVFNFVSELCLWISSFWVDGNSDRKANNHFSLVSWLLSDWSGHWCHRDALLWALFE